MSQIKIPLPSTHYIQKRKERMSKFSRLRRINSELFSFVGQALSEGNAVLIEERDGEYRVTLWKERKNE